MIIGGDERFVEELFRKKPDMKFIFTDHIADQQIVRPLVAHFNGLFGHQPRLQQDDLVSMKEPRELHRNRLAPAR